MPTRHPDRQPKAPQALLTLSWQRRNLTLEPGRDAVCLGSRATAELCVERPFASREHARIERRKQCYVLVDHSTNGTYVQTEDEQVAFVRRGEVRLWGEGWISLGEPLSAPSAIRFRHDG